MATAYKLSTNKNFRGAKVYPKTAGVRVRRLTAAGQPDMSTAGVLRSASRPAVLGTGTGRQLVPTTGTGPGWLEVTDAKGKAGWVRFDLLGSLPVASIKVGDGKALVQAYLRNEVSVSKVLARNRVLLDMRSKSISAAADPLLTEQKRLELRQKDRQRRILAAKDVIKVTSVIDPFHLVFKPESIKRWYGISGIGELGAIPLVAWAVAAGVVAVVGVTWAVVYNHFKTDASASEIDLNKAESLAALLDKADPVTAKKVQEEIAAYGKEQYETGAAAAVTENDKKTGGLLGEAGSLLKWGGIAFIAAKILL